MNARIPIALVVALLATAGTLSAQHVRLPAVVTLKNGTTFETELPLATNLVRHSIVCWYELTGRNVKIINPETGKKQHISAQTVKRISFVDLNGRNRVFMHTFQDSERLCELVRDGKIRWMRYWGRSMRTRLQRIFC